MHPGGWTSAARAAGAEPLLTGRGRPYDESALRRAADQLDAEGCSARIAQAMWDQVDEAVCAMGEPVVAHTDLTDQPYYTKKYAHAAPIGRLGNRLLAAAYFGLTTVAIPSGPTLFLHLSWHKPAAPLHDGLVDLYAEPERLAWCLEHISVHIWDRGANGDRTLTMAWDWEVPYLTIGRESAELWRFHAATMRSEHGSPLVFRPDLRLGGTMADGPWVAIVSARPDDPTCERGICFRTAVPLTESDLRTLTVDYKSRWPSMENLIKALLSRGFGRNRTRALEMTTSRGVDGAVERLKGREREQRAKVAQLATEPAGAKNLAAVVKAFGQVQAAQAAQVAVVENATLKNARIVGGSERLAKQLHLLTQNALSLALYGSDDEAVRVMEPNTVFALLLDRPAITRIEDGKLTLWVEALDAAVDRRRQGALVAVFNKLALRCRGCAVTIRLRQSHEDKGC